VLIEQVDNETASPPFSSSISSYDDDDGEEIDCESDAIGRIVSRFATSADTIVPSSSFNREKGMQPSLLPWIVVMMKAFRLLLICVHLTAERYEI